MATNTTNYNIVKPAPTENYDVAIVNSNSDIIDTTLFNKVDKVAGKSLVADSIMTDLTDLGDSSAHYHSTDRNTDNHTDGTTNKVFSATEKTKLAGIETGAEVNNISDVNATDLTDSGDTTLHKHDRYADKLMATNLIANGDFSNGTTGWSGFNSTIAVANNTLSATGDGAYATARLVETIPVAYSSGLKIYIKAKVRAIDAGATTIDVRLGGGGMSTQVATAVTSPVQNQWYNVSQVIPSVAGGTSGNFNIQYGISFSNAAAAIGKIMDIQYSLALNLTAIFGAGKEPSVTQMDNMLSTFTNSWFNGTSELTSIISLNNIKADKTQEAWITPTLQNGWVALSAGHSQPKYRKDQFGVVHLKGVVVTGTINTAIFTLPVGYRPALASMFAVLINNVFGKVSIENDGRVIPNTGSTGHFVSIDGLEFPAGIS